jgi:hypothetical protein
MRKAFNFFRSYYETASELSDKDRLAFYDALILEQFTGQKTNLKGMAKFAYISQSHSISSQIEGYNQRLKRTDIKTDNEPLLRTALSEADPDAGAEIGAEAQEKEKGEEKVEYTIYSFTDFWDDYAKKIDTKKCEDKYSKLSEDDRAKIKLNISKYIASTPDIKFRKNPLTYLNGKCWLDEVKEPEREETEREYNLRLWKEKRGL